MVKESWQEHFKAAIKNAENLYSKDSTNISLLLFCLRSKMIPVQIYLDWAKENYQLPVLSEKYFQIHRPQQEFYKQWQKTYSWSAECLPIAEWDGLLIVGCLQKPDDYQNTNSTVFVLTSHEVLDTAWKVYQKKPHAGETDFTDMTAFSATVVATSGSPDFFGTDGELVLQDDAPSEELVEGVAPQDATDEAIEGLEFPSDREKEKHSRSGLTKTLSIALQPMNIEVTKNTQVEDPPMAAVETAAAKKGPRNILALTNPPLESTKENTPIDTIDDFKEISNPGISTSAYLLERIRKQGQDQFDKETLASFQQLKTFFKKSMLLAIADQDLLVKPILWDGGAFETQNLQNSEFNLKTPSIFKVVSGTQKPYHGFVVVNDLNESFFESWNHGQIPDHVTIVPLLEGDLVVGMLMGFGEKSSYNKNVLQFTEKIARDLSQRLFKNPIAKAA